MSHAIFVREHGGPDVLRYEPHDPGAPGSGSLRIRTTAIGVNFIDTYQRAGLYRRPLPFIPGLEAAGIVEGVADDVRTAVRPGDRVVWANAPNAYAQAAIVPAASVVRIPADVADDVAAAAMLQGMTAHYLAFTTWKTMPGDTALVHAAAGGVGLLLVQLLKMAGARVIGTCSTEEKADLARGAGADRIVLYTREDFAEAARRFTDGRGVDVVYDSVGQTTFERSLRSLRPRGLLVSFGQSSGPVQPLNVLRLSDHGSLFLTRPTLAHYLQDRAELELRAGEVLAWIGAGQLKIRIAARFPLAEAAAAHRALEGRATAGKVLLLPT